MADSLVMTGLFVLGAVFAALQSEFGLALMLFSGAGFILSKAR